MNTLQPALDQYYRDGNQAALIEAIEKFRPAPKLVEGWVRKNISGARHFCEDKGWFISPEDDGEFVFLREVTPPDESKRWWHDGDYIMVGGDLIGECMDEHAAKRIVAAHNEAMGFGKEASHE